MTLQMEPNTGLSFSQFQNGLKMPQIRLQFATHLGGLAIHRA